MGSVSSSQLQPPGDLGLLWAWDPRRLRAAPALPGQVHAGRKGPAPVDCCSSSWQRAQPRLRVPPRSPGQGSVKCITGQPCCHLFWGVLWGPSPYTPLTRCLWQHAPCDRSKGGVDCRAQSAFVCPSRKTSARPCAQAPRG